MNRRTRILAVVVITLAHSPTSCRRNLGISSSTLNCNELWAESRAWDNVTAGEYLRKTARRVSNCYDRVPATCAESQVRRNHGSGAQALGAEAPDENSERSAITPRISVELSHALDLRL